MTAATTGPAWSVPGYDVIELLGFGASGEVWLAREAATGEPVALKRLRTPLDLAARDRLRREAAVLAGVDHPHVVRLRTLVSAGEELVLVLDHAAGGSLQRLIASRRLRAGEVVTVAVPLAEALAAVHAQGLMHGDVTPANVLFTADGRPLLSDLGVCRLVGERLGDGETIAGTSGYLDPAVSAGAVPGPAADVHGLAAVCFAALTGSAPYVDERRSPMPVDARGAPIALLAVIEAALDADPRRRPTASEFAAAMFEACPALPVILTASSGPPIASPSLAIGEPPALTHEVRSRKGRDADQSADDPTGARRRGHRPAGMRRRRQRRQRHEWAPRWRAVLVSLLLVCGALSAVAAGRLWADTDSRGNTAAVRVAPKAPAAAAAHVMPRPVDWSAVLDELDRRRSVALAKADPARLADVYAPGSPASARDRALVAELRAADHTARGVRLVPRSIDVVRYDDRKAVLDVVDVMPAYRLVSADGSMSRARPGRPATQWTVTLVRDGVHWRMYDVTRS